MNETELRRDALDFASRQIRGDQTLAQDVADSTIELAERYAEWLANGPDSQPLLLECGHRQEPGRAYRTDLTITGLICLECGKWRAVAGREEEMAEVMAKEPDVDYAPFVIEDKANGYPEKFKAEPSFRWRDQVACAQRLAHEVHEAHDTSENAWCPGYTAGEPSILCSHCGKEKTLPPNFKADAWKCRFCGKSTPVRLLCKHCGKEKTLPLIRGMNAWRCGFCGGKTSVRR